MQKALTGISIALGTLAILSAHPSENGQINPQLVEQYAQSFFEDAGLSLGDMRFHGPDPGVAADQLTQPEKYILFGVRTSSMPGSGPMQPWSQLVYSFVRNYHQAHGTIPAQLSEELIRAEYSSYQQADPAVLDALIQSLRSPITGEWPRLDATAFSRGDCMIRPLTSAEVNHLASKSRYYRRLFQEHQGINPQTGQLAPLEIVQQPFYVRINGETKPLVQMIQYGIEYN